MFTQHIAICDGAVQIMNKTYYKYETFRDASKMVKSKLACYVDFESVLEPVLDVSSVKYFCFALSHRNLPVLFRMMGSRWILSRKV